MRSFLGGSAAACMQRLFSSLCLSGVLAFTGCGGDSDAVVTTTPTTVTINLSQPISVTGGQVQGATSTDGSIAEFKGIPFAAPPIGNLRWKPAQAVVPWTGVKQTVTFASDPMGGSLNPSEDCLYLNVWAKNDGLTKKPVVIFAYGGGNSSGGASGGNNWGESMAAKGVIWINFNYRAGIFGYLAHPLLTAEDPAWHGSGNYGLTDYLAALRWVQSNIAQFGGDPTNVTLAGQSAGASNIQYLTGSPLAAGLYKNVFSMSANTYNKVVPTLASQEAIGSALFGSDALADMRALTSAQLKALSFIPTTTAGEAVTDDGVVIKVGSLAQLNQGAIEAYKNGTAQKVNMVATQVSDDARYAEDLVLSDDGVRSFNIAHQTTLTQTGFTSDVGLAFGSALSATAFNLYPAASGLSDYMPIARQINGEGMMGKLTYSLAPARATNSSNPTYIGTFAHLSQGQTGYALHASDIPYWFGYVPSTGSATDVATAGLMSAYMVNFAKTGSPNGNDAAGNQLPTWPSVLPHSAITYLLIGDAVAAQTTLDANKSSLWNDYVTQILADTVGR